MWLPQYMSWYNFSCHVAAKTPDVENNAAAYFEDHLIKNCEKISEHYHAIYLGTFASVSATTFYLLFLS